MRNMSSRKKAAMMLVPAATAAGFIGLTAQAAHAENGSQAVTYTDLSGGTEHCVIGFDLEYGGNTLSADTSLGGQSDPDCFSAALSVEATYKEKSDGVQVTNSAVGYGGFAGGTWTNVKDAKVSTVHDVTFPDCDTNLSVCSYTFNLSHGK